MDDYRTRRRFRTRKLTAAGFYELRRQRSRTRRRAEQEAAVGTVPSIEQIVHPENLVNVFDDLKHHAGHAAGLDGITYADLGRREVGQIMRDLSKEINNGTYEPSRARHIKIPKSDGRRYRTLKIRSIVYRVVATALATAIGPFFDRMFLNGSHGFRLGRGVPSFLLDLERIIVEQERYVIAQDDIANAFDNVQIDYAVDLYGRYIHDEALLVLINKILHGHRAERRIVGIDQGSALSPLTLNVALHHALDKPFSENAAHPVLLRYADDIGMPCRTVHEGMTAIQAAQDLLDPVGMTLKGSQTAHQPICSRAKRSISLASPFTGTTGRSNTI